MEPDPNLIYQWIKSFSQGDIIILCLVGVSMFLYHKLATKRLINGLSKIPHVDVLLTKEAHALICKNTMLEIKNLLIENRSIASKEVGDLKELLMVTMRADILEAIKNNKK